MRIVADDAIKSDHFHAQSLIGKWPWYISKKWTITIWPLFGGDLHWVFFRS